MMARRSLVPKKPLRKKAKRIYLADGTADLGTTVPTSPPTIDQNAITAPSPPTTEQNSINQTPPTTGPLASVAYGTSAVMPAQAVRPGQQPYRAGSIDDPKTSAIFMAPGSPKLTTPAALLPFAPKNQATPIQFPTLAGESRFPKRMSGINLADGAAQIPETPEQVSARIAAKYGVSGSSQPAPAPTPAPPPAEPTQTAQKPGILASIFNRNQQLKAAANYAEGGIVTGPGGPTDDQVPMTVGGKKVNLSNTEAVLPGKTVNALGGPETLAQLIEMTNGKPPVKGGLKAGGNYSSGADGRPWYQGENVPQLTAEGSAANRPTIESKPGYVPTPPPLLDQALSGKFNGTGGLTLAEIAGTSPPPESAQTSPSTLPEIKPQMSTPAPGFDALKSATGVDDKPAARGLNGALTLASVAGMKPGDMQGNVNLTLASIANNRGTRDNFNAVHAGDGLSFGTTTGANGKPQTMISGGPATTPQYVDTSGNPTNDWTKTPQYAQAITQNEKDSKTLQGHFMRAVASGDIDSAMRTAMSPQDQAMVGALVKDSKDGAYRQATNDAALAHLPPELRALKQLEITGKEQPGEILAKLASAGGLPAIAPDQNATQQAKQLANQGAQLDINGKKLSVTQQQQLTTLQSQIQSEQDPAKKMSLLQSYAAITGKYPDIKMGELGGGQITDPNTGMPITQPKGAVVASNGVLPANVSVIGGPTATSSQPAPPRVGEVRSGYKFKGGDPSKQASWEKA